MVAEALRAARLPADRLTVEITEGQLLSLGSPAARTASRLREDGVQLVIDDFGAGYSSLGYLSRLAVDGVKIDKSLLDGVLADHRARLVLRAVIGLAAGLGMSVVCEGIESVELAALVRDLGAQAGQGFAIHGALSAAELREVLEAPPLRLGGGLPGGRRRVLDLTSRDAGAARLTPPRGR